MSHGDETEATRRQRIIEAALKLFARHGFDGTSTRRIAEAAGVNEALIFYYFSTKEGLLSTLLETDHSYAQEFRAILRDQANRPARELLVAIAEGWLKRLRRESDLTVVLFTTAQTNPLVRDKLHNETREGADRLVEYLQARVDAGELSADLPLETAVRMFVWSLMMFFLNHRHLPVETWNAQAEQFVDELVHVWFNGARS